MSDILRSELEHSNDKVKHRLEQGLGLLILQYILSKQGEGYRYEGKEMNGSGIIRRLNQQTLDGLVIGSEGDRNFGCLGFLQHRRNRRKEIWEKVRF